MADQPTQQIQVKLPKELAGGNYADFIRAWHTTDAFILDFATFSEPPHVDGDKVILDAVITSRVRIPPSQVFELMKALEQQLSMWERETDARKKKS
jgi:hypothetical protein